MDLVKYLYFVALACWVGGMVFFSAVVAPTLHRTLDAENAGRLTRQLFPKYYLFGLLCAGVAVWCLLVLLWRRAMSFWPGAFSLLLWGGAGVALWWLRFSLLPAMNPLERASAEWRQLHRVSVRLNAALVAAGLALLFLLVYARAA
jgi:hypothetical protein